MSDVSLELLEFITFATDLFDLALASFIYNLKFGHLTSKALLHLSKVDALALGSLILLAHGGIKRGMPKLPRH